MKRLILASLLLASTAYAATVEYSVNNFATYVTNRGSRVYKTIPAPYTTPMAYQTNAVCKVFINASSANWFPANANTLYKWQPTSNITNFVFSCNSGTTINVAK